MTLSPSPFDSSFYGISIGRLDSPITDLEVALAGARAGGLAVVFVRLTDADPFNAVLASAGHAPIDTLVTSTLRHLPAIAGRPDLAIEHHARLAGDDVEAVAALTAASIATSHLHYDRRLPIERTRALYAAWGKNDVTGRAQHVIVARLAGELVGYVAILETATTAVIDLIAVAPAHHGRGIGSALLVAFVAWVGDRDIVATVGTQSDNPALALYWRCGFVPSATHFTYHLWLDS